MLRNYPIRFIIKSGMSDYSTLKNERRKNYEYYGQP